MHIAQRSPRTAFHSTMPLKCLRDSEELFAFNITSDDEWSGLRAENAETRCLRMACCQSTVALRTSRLGTRHFAHSRRGECTTAPESVEHLLAKSTVVSGVARTSWTAKVEQGGTTPHADAWVADVLATQTGKKSVAFEIQWSLQTEEETRVRQARYRAAGIRGLWLFRQYDFTTNKEIPAFRLRLDDESKAFQVLIPSPLYSPRLVSAKTDEHYLWQQAIELSRFAEGALTGRLRFAAALNQTMPLEIRAAPTVCWNCHKNIRIVTRLSFAAGKILPGCSDVPCSIYDFDKIPEGPDLLARLVPRALLANHDIGELKLRYSNTVNSRYLSNGCIHCGALSGRFFDHELGADSVAFKVAATLDAAWATKLPSAERHINCWWFDNSF